MKAAVLWERRTPLVIEEIDIADPAPGEARVKIGVSGVCHSDLHQINRDTPSLPPLVLGHEAAGIVEAVGPGVTRVKPGDRVISAFGMRCGECFFCVRGEHHLCAAPVPQHVRISKDGRKLNPFLAVGSFAEYANLDARNLVVIPEGMPLDAAALIACGVSTGIGAVITTAGVEPGASVVVIGIGGVGLNVVQGAALAGAAKIIAVDLHDHKLELAREFGATHGINARETDPVERIVEMTGGGVDYAFDAIGVRQTMEQILPAVRPGQLGFDSGGTAVLVGVPQEPATLNMRLLLGERKYIGSIGGSSRPDRDFPRYVRMYKEGELDLDALVTRRYSLDQINDAVAALERGEIAGRSILTF